MNKFFTALFALILYTSAFSQNYNFTLRSKVSYPNDLSNLWGYTDNDSNEYALVGWYKGVSIVDVTTPKILYLKIQIYDRIIIQDWSQSTKMQTAISTFFEIVDKSTYPSDKYL